jgi:transposase
MSERIYQKTINGNVYYYLQKSHRIKVDIKDDGKTKGTGKSQVVSQTTYLGTAESIKNRLLTIREPIEVKNRHFGFVAAILSVAEEIGLVALLKEHIKGKRHGIDNWKYFIIAIINRLQHATSKEKMGKWASGTVLPNLLDFDAKKLNSKSFWYATDDVISEKELQEERKVAEDLSEDVFTNINDSAFKEIEKKLVQNIMQLYNISPDVTLYDTTNFFTYFSKTNESLFAQAGHCKAGRHSNRLIGLALCVEQQFGIPLFHDIYQGNSHDSKTFYQITTELISTIKETLKLSNDVTLIIDKGNNSEENFKQLKDKIEWIGSLSVYNHKELASIPIEEYHGTFKGSKYYELKKKIYGMTFKLVLSYNDILYRKNEHTFNNSIEKFKAQLNKKWFEYKKNPKKVTDGINTMLKDSKHKDYLTINCIKGALYFKIDKLKIEEKKKYWGKHIIFSSNLNKTYDNIIEFYNSKDKIEKGFELIKSPDLIRWIPMRHWTDSKIRTFAFSCVMSLTLIRIMELKLERENLKMSPNVIKQELQDLQQTILIYDVKNVVSKITAKSTIQNKLYEIFNLSLYETNLTIH